MSTIAAKLTVKPPLTIPWAWYSSRNEYVPTDAIFRADESRVSASILVRGSDVPTALRDILGYPTSAGDKLLRHPPMPYPQYPWLMAESVASIKQLNIEATVEGGAPLTAVSLLVVSFAFPPYDILPDGTPEYKRWVTRTARTTARFISMEQGAYRYSQGCPAGVKGLPVTQGPGYVVQESIIQLLWRQIPDSFVLDAAGLPSRFNQAIGSVNDGVFLNLPPGTLLLESAEPELIGCPVAPAVINGTRLINLRVSFRYSDPPNDPQTQGAVYGWNLVPAPAMSGKLPFWYPIVSVGQGGADGNLLYESSHFPDLFTGVGA